jgi:hypothetical protein
MKDANFFLVVRFSIRHEFALLYGIESRAAFEKHMRIERFSGEVVGDYSG